MPGFSAALEQARLAANTCVLRYKTDVLAMNKDRISCIDDNDTNLRLLEKSLCDSFDVQILQSPHDAIAALCAFKPAVILLDVNMPDLNGYELCQQIRQTPALADAPIIFVTCMKDLDDRLAGYAAGGDAYLTKPFDLRELKSLIQSLLVRKKSVEASKRNAEELRAMSWTMLRNTSEMGELLRFSQGIAKVKDEVAFVDHLFTTLGALNLSATVLVRLLSGEVVARSDGKPFTLIEKELLDLARNGQRITAQGNKYIFHSDNIVLLIRNMPLADEALLGRMKDHLCILLDSAEASIAIINGEKQRAQLQISRTDETISAINAEFDIIIDTAEKLYRQSSASIERLASALEHSFMVMDLTETQEQQILKFIEESRRETEKQHELKALFQSSMMHILERVANLKNGQP